jgi:hydrogenase maturation protease
MADEGIGIHVVRRLQTLDLPDNVEVIDGGTTGFELLPLLEGRRRVIIVDCLIADEPPGTVICAAPEQLDLQWSGVFSAHQSGLRELLAHVTSLEPPPLIRIVGVVPEEVSRPGTSLSRTLATRLDAIASEVLRLCDPAPE